MAGFDDLAAEAVDITFETLGRAATYTPPGGGAALPCTVIKRSPDADLGSLSGQPMMQGDLIEVRKSEVAAPAREGVFVPGLIVDGVFVPGPDSFVVQSDPRSEDAFRLVWTITVA